MRPEKGLIQKAVKITQEQHRWLKAHPEINFSRWIRDHLDQQIRRAVWHQGKGVSALVLAAGSDRPMLPFNRSIPKALLEVRGKSIFQRQREVLEDLGVGRIGVVRGYQKQKFFFPGIYYYDNPDYTSRGILHSLTMGMDFLIDSTLILYADILFRRSVLDRLLQTKGDLILAIDPAIPSRRRREKGRVVEAVSFQDRTAKRAASMIKRLSRHLPRSQQDGEFVGVGLIRDSAIDKVKKLLMALNADSAQARADLLALFQAWIDSGEKLYGMTVSSEEWMDVDTFEDYRDAWSRFES